MTSMPYEGAGEEVHEALSTNISGPNPRCNVKKRESSAHQLSLAI